jgi:type II secretion system protein H
MRRRPPHRRARAGFTLVELLLVVAVIGVLAAAAAPAVSTMIAGGRLRTAARELAGSGRYARTMALLNQTPVDLVVDLKGGRLAVRARDREELARFGLSDLAAATNDVGYTEELLRTSARRAASLSGGFGLAVSRQDADAGAATNLLDRLAAESEDGAAPDLPSEVSIADSVDAERELEGVRVIFDGWRDTPSSRRRRDADEDRSAGVEEGDFTVRYRANGTVRPHRWIVCDAEHPEDRLFVTVNAVGRAKVESPD